MKLQYITTESNSIIPTSKDLNGISNIINQDSQQPIFKTQQEVNEVTTNKNEEISHLKGHSHKLLAQVKKAKATKQKLEQEKECLKKKFDENLSEKYE